MCTAAVKTFVRMSATSPGGQHDCRPIDIQAESKLAGTKPNILEQFSQDNGKLAAFGLASGACFTFADVFLQQAMPLVGIVTAAGLSNAFRLVISVLTNYWLDGQLDRGGTLFPGLGLALMAIICSTAAQLNHRHSQKSMRLLFKSVPSVRQLATPDDTAHFACEDMSESMSSFCRSCILVHGDCCKL